MTKNKLTLKIVLTVIIGTLITAGAYYLLLPPANIHSVGFWGFLIIPIACYTLPFLFEKSENGGTKKKRSINYNGTNVYLPKPGGKIRKIPMIIMLIPVAVIIIGGIVSSEVFNAQKYANVITVTEAKFDEDMKETNEVTNIALMDSESAQIFGNRTLGKLSDVVSQYEIGDRKYTQINYGGKPKKVANLEYAGFFKWAINREKGVPGYVIVDPVINDGEYVKLDTPLKYVDSAYFNDNLMRKLRFEYPTKIFDFVSFEIDEEGKPYYIVSCVSPNAGLFGAMDVDEVIIFDPCNGESKLYALSDVPDWVDAVFSGDLAEEKYNWKGMLSGGFINSIIGNVGCKQTTDDYGYIVIGDDVWYFTGVTSVTNDASNIGFIISNARTGEYKYYPVVGAEEYSAMKSAEGKVQNMGYNASFPSLINVSGQATYIMVLKDDGGYVKLYALVNVENVGLVATGSTQSEAMVAYKDLLVEKGVIKKEEPAPIPEEEKLKAEFKVEAIRDVVIGGDTYFYITGDDGYTYKCKVADFESVVLVSVGDTVAIEYELTENEKIRNIVKY